MFYYVNKIALKFKVLMFRRFSKLSKPVGKVHNTKISLR